jgi:uncharacterized protein (DUF2236 family)
MAGMTITERVNGERLILLGWGRAILMQLAHPMVAQGVADHSGFRDTTLARVRRLHETIKAMLDLTFGDAAASDAAVARINAIHDRVHGQLSEDAGPWTAGTPYSATDPQLLTWVEATLLDSMPFAYQQLVAPLAPADLDAYCSEASAASERLRIPAGLVPSSRAALDAYFQRVIDSNALVVTSHARELAREVIAPPGATALWPASTVARLASVGWLPPRIRAAYGFSWAPRDQARLTAWCRRIRAARRLVPDRWARWSAARS